MFPTHVGMNRELDAVEATTLYVPHTRGDEPAETALIVEDTKYSPHTWG